jgi:Tol biopolymer transport system component
MRPIGRSLSLAGIIIGLAACGGGSDARSPLEIAAPSAAAGAAPGAVSKPPPPQPGTSIAGKIAFARDGNVWVYSGSSAKQFTTVGSAADPAWSPDGQTLAFDKQDKNSADLYTQPYPQGQAKAVSNNASRVVENNLWDMQPDWSTDGLSLAFVTDRARARTGTLDPAVWRLTLSSGARAQLSRANQYTGGVDFPRWRPQYPSDVLYTSWSYEQASLQPYGQLTLMNTQTSTTHALTEGGQSAMQPSWSPDGEAIVFVNRGPRGDELRIMSLANPISSAAGLTPTATPEMPASSLLLQGMVAHPVWSPDGKAIAYLGLKDGSFDLFAQPLTTSLQPDGQPKQLTVGLHIEAASSIGWSR